MGKGDKKTTKGKIAKGTYGNSRPQRPDSRKAIDEDQTTSGPSRSGIRTGKKIY